MLMFYLDAKVLRKSPVSTLNPSNTSLKVLTVLQGFQGGLNNFNPEQSDGFGLMRDKAFWAIIYDYPFSKGVYRSPVLLFILLQFFSQDRVQWMSVLMFSSQTVNQDH
jgi:hypothetical protein